MGLNEFYTKFPVGTLKTVANCGVCHVRYQCNNVDFVLRHMVAILALFPNGTIYHGSGECSSDFQCGRRGSIPSPNTCLL